MNSILGTPPQILSNPNFFPVALLPNSITWLWGGVVEFQHKNFVETQTFSKIKNFELRFLLKKKKETLRADFKDYF